MTDTPTEATELQIDADAVQNNGLRQHAIWHHTVVPESIEGCPTCAAACPACKGEENALHITEEKAEAPEE